MTQKVVLQTSDVIIEDLNSVALGYPRGAPNIKVGHPAIGDIGVCEPGIGFKLQGMSSRTFAALMRDQDKAFRNPRKYLKECGAITSWDGVLTNRAAGSYDDRLYWKNSQTTVANVWSSFFRSTGVPTAGDFTTVASNGSILTNANNGSLFIHSPSGANNTYLLNFGVQHLVGTNIVMLVDLLWGANAILTSAANNFAITQPALTRYTDGAGVYFICEVANAIGASAGNIVVTYNNHNNANSITASIALTASAANFRLQPISTTAAPSIQLANGDLGVRSVKNIQITANMGAGGILMAMLYKPLLLIPTLAVTTYVERSTPGMLAGITLLPKDASNNLGCLAPFILASTTSTGVQSYWLQTVEG